VAEAVAAARGDPTPEGPAGEGLAAVSDQKPPRVLGDERATLLSLLQYQRDSVLRKLDGLDEVAVRWSPVPSGTSLLWILKHLTMAETIWFAIRFAGRDVVLPNDAVGDDDTIAGVVDAYRAAWAATDEIVARAQPEDHSTRAVGDEPVDLRWILAHIVEETARHAGHADIVRELLDGRTGR
jgi:hypothetical protein